MRCDFLIEAVVNIDAALIDEAENFRPRTADISITARLPKTERPQ